MRVDKKLLTMAILIALGATDVLAGAEAEYVKTSKGELAKPILAVNHVCAWPNNLAVLEDATIVACIFNKPSHAHIAGNTECWASMDRGRTWRKRGTVAQAEPNTLRTWSAAGVAGDGDLVVICGGLSNIYPPGRTGPPFRAETLSPWVCRSNNGGRKWTVDKDTFPRKAPDGGDLWPFGQIVRGDDGILRASIYSASNFSSTDERPYEEHMYIYTSRDDGRTWDKVLPMDSDSQLNETSLLQLETNTWLAAARFKGLHLYKSTNNGETWHRQRRLTDPDQHPGHLLKLRNGCLVLTYGNRIAGKYGVEVRRSDDQGKTWTAPVRVVDLQHRDCGHPSSVQLPDGSVLTAYYGPKIAYHVTYHMGVVIWDPKKSLDQ